MSIRKVSLLQSRSKKTLPRLKQNPHNHIDDRGKRNTRSDPKYLMKNITIL